MFSQVGANGRKQEASCFPSLSSACPRLLCWLMELFGGRIGPFPVAVLLSELEHEQRYFLVISQLWRVWTHSSHIGVASAERNHLPCEKVQESTAKYSHQGPRNSLSFAISIVSNNSKQSGLSFCGVEQWNGSRDNGSSHNIPGVRGLRLLSTEGPVQWLTKPVSWLLLCSVTTVHSCR